ncbi:putative membrane protein [Shewanella psychrophila]|uniref:Putative membrane protein n=1 Tax=Shewanella psychrophila TaxID=225848 RepID=A0A1S6HQL0_9GAMM|nr:PH domain-containing protein [Shewanella psychrophila]AQS37837.1 putative membrane protein [Shewanella psychrophila]
MHKRFSLWSGLSPWSIISYTLNTIRLVITNGYAMVPVVYTGWKQGFNSPWVIVAAVGVTLAVFVYAIVQWAMFRYRLFEDKLGVRQGLIFKKTHEIPLSKIQNVRLEQPFYFRPMGLYSLVVETAGSKEDEAVLAAVSYRKAIQLKKRLVNPLLPTPLASDPDDVVLDEDPILDERTKPKNPNKTLVRKDLKQLLLFGLYQNNLFWFAIIAGPILGQLDWSQLADTQMVQSAMQWYERVVGISVLYQIVLGSLLLIGFYFLLSLISMAASVLKYYPYHLSRDSNTLHRSGGVIAKQNDALALQRIQVIRFSQPVIGRLLSLWTVYFKQVQGTEVEQKSQRHMLVPSMTRKTASELLSDMNGIEAKTTILPTRFNPIHFGWYWRRALAPLIVPAVNTIGMGLNPITEIMWFIGLGFTLGLYLRYRQWGYYLDGSDFWIHTGMLGHSWHLVPLRKVQHVAITQTQGQRRKGLATLELGLASGTQTIPYMPLSDAREIAERALAITARSPKNWI